MKLHQHLESPLIIIIPNAGKLLIAGLVVVNLFIPKTRPERREPASSAHSCTPHGPPRHPLKGTHTAKMAVEVIKRIRYLLVITNSIAIVRMTRVNAAKVMSEPVRS